MSHLAKLNLKTVQRNTQKEPVIARRDKLLAAIEEQLRVVDDAKAGKQYIVAVKRWRKNEAGEKQLVDAQKKVRSWFFEQDGGWYVQCKYGSRAIQLSKDANSVFVKDLGAVKGALEAFYAACVAGEFDESLKRLVSKKP